MKRIAIGLLTAALIAVAQRVDDAERMLKAAQNIELVDGNLQRAVQEYKKISQGGNRSVAAQALLRMAECYQKLGDAEARKVYERVVRDFADQSEAAAVARARLQSRSGSPAGSLTARRLWTRRQFWRLDQTKKGWKG